MTDRTNDKKTRGHGGRHFKKGDPGGPGRPKDPPEMREFKKLKKTEFKFLLHKFLGLTYEQLEVLKGKGTVMEDMLIKQAMDAIDKGETLKIEFFTDRLFGKAPDILKVDAEMSADITHFDGKILKSKLNKIREDV